MKQQIPTAMLDEQGDYQMISRAAGIAFSRLQAPEVPAWVQRNHGKAQAQAELVRTAAEKTREDMGEPATVWEYLKILGSGILFYVFLVLYFVIFG